MHLECPATPPVPDNPGSPRSGLFTRSPACLDPGVQPVVYCTVLYCVNTGQTTAVSMYIGASAAQAGPHHLPTFLQYSTVLSSYVTSCHTVYVSYHVISAVCGEVTNMLTAFCKDIHCSYATFQVPIFVSRITLLYCMEVAFKVECP